MKKKSTGTKNKELLEQYRRERRRVNQLIRRAEKRGFIIPKSAKPGKPLKRPTEKSIERLKAITPEAIYERAKYKSQGKTYRGEEARTIARKEAREQTAKKKAEQAKTGTQLAADKEEIQLEIITAYNEKNGEVSLSTLKTNLTAKG